MPICGGTTKEGKPCKRLVPEGQTCFQHPKSDTQIIVPDINHLPEFGGKFRGMKIIPFLIRTGNTRICNPRSGYNKLKKMNSIFVLKYDGDAFLNKPKWILPSDISDKIRRCKNLVIISLSLLNIIGTASHSNLLIFDPLSLEVERFEPRGDLIINKMSLNNRIDNQVIYLLKGILPEYKYIKPLDYCPKIGPQRVIRDSAGLCSSFSALYGNLRILNPNVNRKTIVEYMIKNVDMTYLRKFMTYVNHVITDQQMNIWIASKDLYS